MDVQENMDLFIRKFVEIRFLSFRLCLPTVHAELIFCWKQEIFCNGK